MKCAVSVIVPVYNTSKFLRKCLESLRSQSLEDIEFILVDDGSTDDSGRICDEYAVKDSRFKVIHQENAGSALARQTGMDIANGEYIIICDSDDWVESDMYSKLYFKAKESNADMAVCQCFFEYPDGTSIPNVNILDVLFGDGLIKEMMMNPIHNASWIKLVKRDLFINNDIRYSPGINMGEDCLILYKLLKTHPVVVQLPDPLYHYRRNLNGSNYTSKINMNQVKQAAYVNDWIRENFTNNEFSYGIWRKDVNLAITCLRAVDIDNKFLKSHLRNHLKWKDLFRNGLTLKALFSYLCKIFPISVMRYTCLLIYPSIHK